MKHNQFKIDVSAICLGVDQSFAGTGFVVNDGTNILAAERFTTKNTESNEDRILKISNRMIDLINQYDVYTVLIEGVSYNSSGSATRDLAGLFYVLVHELNVNGVHYVIIPPKSLKLHATGIGNATKEEMKAEIPSKIMNQLLELSKVRSAKNFFDIVDAYHLSNYIFSPSKAKEKEEKVRNGAKKK